MTFRWDHGQEVIWQRNPFHMTFHKFAWWNDDRHNNSQESVERICKYIGHWLKFSVSRSVGTGHLPWAWRNLRRKLYNQGSHYITRHARHGHHGSTMQRLSLDSNPVFLPWADRNPSLPISSNGQIGSFEATAIRRGGNKIQFVLMFFDGSHHLFCWYTF